MKYYSGKTVLITGAFGGFGRHFINQLLEAGANLILSDLAAKKLSEVVENKKWERRAVAVIEADLSTSQGCKKLYDGFKTLDIPLDMIVHNAGVAFLGQFVDVPLQSSEKLLDINLMSVVRLNSHFIPDFISQGSGHLIYVSSVAGFVATPFGAPYSASKSGLKAFAMAVHGEIKSHGVKTSITYPFWAKTPIMKSQVFGNSNIRTMPDFFASDPEYVVRATLKGAARGKLNIRPGFFSQMMWQAARLMPIIAEQRFMRDELIEY